MKKNLQCIALLMVFAVSACKKDVQQPSTEITESVSGANERAAASNINLSVTVEDDISNVNKIRSDNDETNSKGPYINGRDLVQAQILSSDGNFYMNTNSNTVKSPIRTLKVLPGTDVDLSGVKNYSLRTTNTTWLQNMAVGGEPQLVGFRVWGVQQSGVVDWKLLYHNGIEDNATTLTDYAKVTRLSNDEWTIESYNTATARLVDGSNNPKGSEYYQAPFKLRLKRIK